MARLQVRNRLICDQTMRVSSVAELVECGDASVNSLGMFDSKRSRFVEDVYCPRHCCFYADSAWEGDIACFAAVTSLGRPCTVSRRRPWSYGSNQNLMYRSRRVDQPELVCIRGQIKEVPQKGDGFVLTSFGFGFSTAR